VTLTSLTGTFDVSMIADCFDQLPHSSLDIELRITDLIKARGFEVFAYSVECVNEVVVVDVEIAFRG
jgi:hypothetical protein